MLLSSLNNYQIYSIEVFETNNLHQEDEEVKLEIYDHIRSRYDGLNCEQIFFKGAVKIGRANDNDLQTKDAYTAPLHTKIDFTNWFRKRRPLVKQYDMLLRTRRLPTDLCRYIMDYIKEPRAVVIKDWGCANSTLIGLTMGLDYTLGKGQRFRLPQIYDLIIENIASIRQKDEESAYDVQMRIEEAAFYSCDAEIYHDLSTRENKQSSEYHILCFEVSKVSEHKQKFMIVSNKSHSSFVVGCSFEAQIYINLGMSSDFQYEINLDNGVWSVKELRGQGYQQKMWLNLRGEPDKEYKIVKDTEISIGRTLVKVLFPPKRKCK